jgi:hypothetical protein
MGMFDDVPMVGAAPAPAAPVGPGMFDDVPLAPRSTAADVAQSFGTGVAEGIAAIPGAVGDLAKLAPRLGFWAGDKIRGAMGLEPNDPRIIQELDQPVGRVGGYDIPLPGTAANIGMIEAATGPLPKPQTMAGEYARTIGENVPGAVLGPSGAAQRAFSALGPALASETAGQLTKGQAIEPWARGGAALAAGGVQELASRPGIAQRTAISELRRMPEAQRVEVLTGAQGRLDEAARTGFPLSSFNALDDASGGALGLSEVQRQAEGMGRLRDFYAGMPDQVDRAAAARFDTIVPQAARPEMIGPDVSEAARGVIAASPEGQAFAQAERAIAPRISPDDAGQVIQGELAAQRAQYEAVRRAQGATDYDAARAAPERFGVERMVDVERPGPPVVTYPEAAPRFSADAPAPLEATTAPGSDARGARGESFTRYLAKGGGIPLDADSRGADLNRVAAGFGTLARRNAPNWNHWRVRLVEDGWLGDDALRLNDTEVADRVREMVRAERVDGQRASRLGDELDQETQAATRSEYENGLSTVRGQLDRALEGVGVAPDSLPREVRSRTLNALMGDPSLDPLDAYERVVGAMREGPRPLSKTTTIRDDPRRDLRAGQPAARARRGAGSQAHGQGRVAGRSARDRARVLQR